MTETLMLVNNHKEVSVELKDIARRLPNEIWSVFDPLLPPAVWVGNGRPPSSNRDCLHGILYVLITGIAWEMMPPCFPCYKTCQTRYKQWLEMGAFQQAWTIAASRYDDLRGINWDQICVDGSKHPAKKGARTLGRLRLTVARREPLCTSPRMDAACRSLSLSAEPTPTTEHSLATC